MKREIDRHSGLVETFHMDDEGNIAFQMTADVEPAIEDNKRAISHGDGFTPSRDMVRVASIPIAIQYEWIQKFGVDPLRKENEPLLKRLLNSNEYRYLRTSEIII
jgi:hypothetical protein